MTDGPAWTVGVDVGGTFTDFAAVERATGRVVHHKQPTDAVDPAAGVARGIDAVLAKAGAAPAAVEAVVHGTTLGLNALLQRRGARVALVVSRGFGDMLELARGDLPNSYDYKAPKPVPPIPRERVLEVDARQRPDGSVLARPTPAAIEALAARLRALEVEAVAVSVLNAYVDPALEDEIGAALERRLPGVLVTRAARLWPEVREYERTLVAVLNGMIHPLLDRYYGALGERLRGLGLSGGLYLTTSTGGSVPVATARERPIETVLSGPASGVFAAARLAAQAGEPRAVSLDMGGTSSDMSIADGAAPAIAVETRLGDFPLMLPAVDMWAIGAGGGSIVWIDPEGVLKVGPRSAGARPGPVCYGQGATEPTLTDCYLVAGYLNPDYFLGGRVRLDLAAARTALDTVGARLGLADDDRARRAADAALRVATARMAAAIVNGFASRGLDPRRFTLLPYGGAGPTQAVALAEAAGLAAILLPPSPGTFCALGAALADLRRDFARSRRVRIGVDAEAGAALAGAAAEMEREARAWLAEASGPGAAALVAVSADLQYPRTAAALTLPVPEAAWRAGDAAAFAELFHRGHERAYGFRDASSPVDVTTLRLTVSRPRAPVAPAPAGEARAGRGAAAAARPVHWRGATLNAAVWRRDALSEASTVDGPALVEQEDTTVWIGPGWSGRIDRFGNLRLDRRPPLSGVPPWTR